MTNNLRAMQFQEEFKKRLFLGMQSLPFETPLIWQSLAKCDQDIIKNILGDVGFRLKELIDKIDLEHPDIGSIFDGSLANDHKFAQQCIEIITLAEFAKEKQFLHAMELVQKTIIQDAASTLRIIDLASKNRTSIRFLKGDQERKQLRLQKRMQTIDLSGLYKKGFTYWESLPENFNKFLRFDDAYEDDLALAEKKVQQYQELGCTSLAEEIQRSIETFKSNIKQSYFGFNRLTMANAAAILAKSLGFQFSSYCNNWDSFDKQNYAGVDSKPLIDFLSTCLSVDNSQITIPEFQDDYFFYEPRIYPYHHLSELASVETKQIVDHLEKLPEANNKPIFDHFGIIVPSIKLFQDSIEDKDWLVRDLENLLPNLKTKEDIIFEFDKTLLQKKYFDAIIIAEKDGKCYFICYFD